MLTLGYDFQFICPRHRQWLQQSPDSASACWQAGFERAQKLISNKDWLNAWRHAGRAYEAAQLMVRNARHCDRSWLRRHSASAAQLSMVAKILQLPGSQPNTVH